MPRLPNGSAAQIFRTKHLRLIWRFRCQPLPKVPIMLLFWDADRETGFEAKVKLAFDETITEHLDIESIIFLCEHLARMLINR